MLKSMLSWSRRRAFVVAGLLAATASVWLSRGRAAAQTRYEKEPATFAQLRDKVANLEARLRVVEKYMREDCEYPYEETEPGVKRVKLRCLGVMGQLQKGRSASSEAAASFSPAYGAHRKQASAASVSKTSCDPPYTISANGIKSYKEGCL